jgi:hypothetical protein
MREQEIEAMQATYLEASGGDLDRAFWAAVADLLDIHSESELRKAALDLWVSPGYVRGRASEILTTGRTGPGPSGETP